jgi:peptidylprolyl isomerase
MRTRIFALVLPLLFNAAYAEPVAKPITASEILAASKPEEWRSLDPTRTIVMMLAGGREVVIELAPDFAPNTVVSIIELVRQGFFDGTAVLRSQDNYVAQWGTPDETDPIPEAASRPPKRSVPAEFDRPLKGLDWARLKDGDVYAPRVGFVDELPVATDGRRAWLAHCYGMVGVGRDTAPDSGDGSSLYVVTGHAPRHLDRNVTLVGRVLSGMQHLSSLPRGTGPLGFYETAEERTPIVSIRVSADMADGGTTGRLEILRSDSESFAALLEARRNSRDGWTVRPAGKIDLCNARLPVREKP